MSVNHVMGPMSHVCVLKNQLKKLGSHCSNAVVGKDRERVFSDRFVYKTGFVNRELFDTIHVTRLLSVYKYVQPSLSFADVLKRGNVAFNHVNVHSSMKRSDKRVQRPKVQNSTKTSQYGKVRQHNAVVKDSTGPVFQQGVSLMDRHVCSHVKSNDNHVSILNDSREDRFVHMNRFQPLVTCDIERNMESNCQHVQVRKVRKVFCQQLYL